MGKGGDTCKYRHLPFLAMMFFSSDDQYDQEYQTTEKYAAK